MSKTTKRDHVEPLAVVLEAYPGGMSQLATDAGIDYALLIKFKQLRHSREPHDILRAMAALDWSDVPFAPSGYYEWLAKWRGEKRLRA